MKEKEREIQEGREEGEKEKKGEEQWRGWERGRGGEARPLRRGCFCTCCLEVWLNDPREWSV